MINILDVKPHVVSRDLSGYTTLLYGDPKSGKTTCATRFPKSLLLALEKGYAALPGVMALPINTWGDYLTALRQLKDEAAKEKFSTIIIDTVDIVYDTFILCVIYMCVSTIVMCTYRKNRISSSCSRSHSKTAFNMRLS